MTRAFEATTDSYGTRELYAGTDRAIPLHRQVVGSVTYGRWQVGRLDGGGRIAELPRPDADRWALYLAEIPHTLRFDDPRRTPPTVSVGFELLDDEASAYDILPRSVTDPSDTPATYTISTSLRFTQGEAPLRGSAYEIALGPLEPIVLDAGLGEGSFGWSYQAPAGSTLKGGGRRCWVILQVPRGLSAIRIRAASLVRTAGIRGGGQSEACGFTVTLPD
jgi:hypothetical protein